MASRVRPWFHSQYISVSRLFLLLGAVSGFISVALGAFGAHALEKILSANSLSIFSTAHEYQITHSLVLLVTGILLGFQKTPNENRRLLVVSGYSFLVGIVLFSGSLYGLALTGISILGAITPLGGLAFSSGWLTLGLYAYKLRPSDRQID